MADIVYALSVPRSSGPGILYLDLGDPDSQTFNWVELGITGDGVELEFESAFNEIKSDVSGGADGILFNDLQYLGTVARIRASLVKFNPALIMKIYPQVKLGTDETTLPDLGSFMIAGERYFRLRIFFPKNINWFNQKSSLIFPKVYLTGNPSWNMGTKFTTVDLEFTAMPVFISPSAYVGKIFEIVQES